MSENIGNEKDLYREAESQSMQRGRRRRFQQPPELSNAGEAPIIQAVDRGPEIVATTLAPQLGSNSADLASGQVDMRRFSVISESDIPFLMYAKIRGQKSRVWRTIYSEYLNLKVSINGLGRRQIIRMEGVSRGGMPAQESFDNYSQKPSWWGRNFTNRNWREKVERERM